MQNLFSNWRTTSSGLVIIIGALVHLAFGYKNKTLDETTVTTGLIAVVTGLGLMFAGDAATSLTKDEGVTKNQADTTFIKKPGMPSTASMAANTPSTIIPTTHDPTIP
jgi:hypothetical protein